MGTTLEQVLVNLEKQRTAIEDQIAAIKRAIAGYPAGNPVGRPRAHRTCTVTGCNDPHVARGLCNAHYAKWRRDKIARRLAELEGRTK